MPEKEKILVLSVDRDNDIGEKAKINGPIIGKENVLKAANALGLADPEDTDFNTLFQAVKVFNKMSGMYNVEVAAITGDKNVGIESDRKISEQLNKVLKKFPADYVVLVTDGAEDEHTIPIIQSKVPILSINRLVVRQAEELESSYYKIKDFIEESLENPKYARLVFGLPAIALLLYGLFGVEGWRAIVGIFGVYLLIKGFKLESYILSVVNELKTSFTRKRFAFFTYIVATAFALLATFQGYTNMLEWSNVGVFETVAAFINASVYYYFLAGTSIWIGRNVSLGKQKRKGRTIISVPLFGLAISLVIFTSSELILSPKISILNFMFSIVVGFAILFVALLIEWKA
jgi:putative membrane protein